MCSGKTRIGRELARVLKRRHIDLDRAIEADVGPLVPFFQQHGEAAFREREKEKLAELLSAMDVIISTGGGTPAVGDNLEKMMAAGTVIWLDVPMPTLLPRIERTGRDRPLLLGLSGKELQHRVESLMEERIPFYSRAHLIVQAAAPPDVLAARIKQILDLQER